MKKKIFGAVLITAMAVAAGWNFNQSKNETQLSDLTLANVEALAHEEGIQSGDACYSDGKYDANEPKVVVCAESCYYESRDLPWFPSKSYCK